MSSRAGSRSGDRSYTRGTSARSTVESILRMADIDIDGDRPWDIRVSDDRFYRRLLTHGSLGAGESYMDGWWDCERLDEMFCCFFGLGLENRFVSRLAWLGDLNARLLNLQRPSRAFRIGRKHYDIGNDLYRAMLGERMIYSCGYWRNSNNLSEAQEAKLDLVCRKLGLEQGMRVLDIGCGWGGSARFAVERYDVSVVGITVSEQQATHARQHCRGLPIEILLQDYRGLEGTFDRVFSLGMFEHVGYKNYATYMRVVRDHLTPDGLFLLHTIAGNRSVTSTDPWIARYIFPGSMLPSPRQIAAACEGCFVLEDWHNFGADYDRTLLQWHANFERSWGELAASYSRRFYRMWRYYLLLSAGVFRARANQLWQVVASPQGVRGGYRVEL